MANDPVVIVGSKRTPLGVFRGALSGLSAPILGSRAIEAALAQSTLAPEKIQSVWMGCVLSAGLGQAPARQAALKAGLPVTTPATLVNKVCGSSLQAIACATQEVLAHETGYVTIAGGMESMTGAPYILPGARMGYKIGHQQACDHLFTDGLQDAYSGDVMGVFADKTAEKYHLTRDMQDAYATASASRAIQALAEGAFGNEITPLETAAGVLKEDEPPSRLKLDKIPRFKPAFSPNGTVTAATSSSLADGAAALVLTRLSTAHKNDIPPLAIIRGMATHAHEPEWFTTAPLHAISKLASQVGWLLSDVDAFEINEAFAVVPMTAIQALNIPASKVNMLGGACALGHPLGASGARIVVTLLNVMQRHNLTRGIAALCIGGGEAIAIAVERPGL